MMSIPSFLVNKHQVRTMATIKESLKRAFVVAGLFVLAAINLVKADTVSVLNPSCIGVQDGIEINFEKDLDENFDDNWIAIIRTQSNLASRQSLPSGQLWASLCGSQNCAVQTNSTSGSIVLNGNNFAWDDGDWPLEPGTYQAVLTLGGDGEAWPALAASELFRVGCDVDSGNSGSTSNPGIPTMDVIRDARQDIRQLIGSNPPLVGKFLRLAFHDCVGGCDGMCELCPIFLNHL